MPPCDLWATTATAPYTDGRLDGDKSAVKVCCVRPLFQDASYSTASTSHALSPSFAHFFSTLSANSAAEFVFTHEMRERLHTYSNAFLSRYNASTPCFCTTLCQLTCRTSSHPPF